MAGGVWFVDSVYRILDYRGGGSWLGKAKIGIVWERWVVDGIDVTCWVGQDVLEVYTVG